MQKPTSPPSDELVPVGIVGGSGYAGLELVRLVVRHPRLRLAWIFSRTHTGRPVRSVHPSLAGIVETAFTATGDPASLAGAARVVFMATPPGTAAELAPVFLEAGALVVDLSADFRFADPTVYEAVYGRAHPNPQLLTLAAYGLTELQREAVRSCRIVANPGCYPTAALLALAPLATGGLLPGDGPVIVSATSGVSGAGSEPGAAYHFPAATENVRPYKVPGHRHTPEISGMLDRLRPGGPRARVSFVPHLVPASRGILATCVTRLSRCGDGDGLAERYREFYRDCPFVRVLPDGLLPETKHVYGSNFCDVAIRWDPAAEVAIAMAAIDNLVKGAAGQAIQNVNVHMGWDERDGLWDVPVYP